MKKNGKRVRAAVLRRSTCVASLLLLLAGGAARGEDLVPVPGGPAAIRRLLRLDLNRPKAAFFLDAHEALIFTGGQRGSWSQNEQRRALVSFAEDLAEWRSEFGNPAVFSWVSNEDGKRTRQALEWLGFKIRGIPPSFTTDRREDDRSVRRQAFLDTLGMPATLFLSKLRAGEKVSIVTDDEEAPLPFGLAAWRETLDEPSLSAREAFLYFVKNVAASRMLVALHALDSDTREGVRVLFRDGKGRALGWRILYEKVLETFTRFPEALTLRDGHFVLPGGKEAEPVWTDIFGVPPSDRLAFLPALFETDAGKAAYVVDVLQQLPQRTARELLLGRTGGGRKAVKRFRRLYRSIERSGNSFEMTRRDPYDFGHLARFLRLSDEGDLLLPSAELDGADFPRSEAELAEIVARAGRATAAPEENLRRLFRRETASAAARRPAQRRFLFVSSLLEGRPALQDPGLTVLLLRGLDRFLPAYAVLEDIPLDGPTLARRYLFTLDRLDRRGSSRDAEVAAGLFEGGVELLAQLSRAGSLEAGEIRDLFSSLLDLPLFARDEMTPGRGEKDLFLWLSDRLLVSLRKAERRLIEAGHREEERREAAYRDALRAREESRRDAAQARLRLLLEPSCAPDDDLVGPLRPRFLEDQEDLALVLSAAAPPEQALAEAEIWMSEALELERRNARPLALETKPARMAGAVPGSSALVDPAEPLPELVRVEIPEESVSSDDLLTRSLAGAPAGVLFQWHGGRYRFDPTMDDVRRRSEFRQMQRLTWLGELEDLHRMRDALVEAAAKGDLAGAKFAASELAGGLKLSPAEGKEEADDDERIRKERERARLAAAELVQISKKKLSDAGEQVADLDVLVAEKHLEALLGHVYAASAGDPNDLYYQDPGFVRRHSFRTLPATGRPAGAAFSRTEIVGGSAGAGSRVTGSLFGLADALGLLHADQIAYKPGAFVSNDEIRSGLVGAVRRVSAARLDEDALQFVADSCRATEEFAAAAARLDEKERARSWSDLARDLVPRSRLGLLSTLAGQAPPASVAEYLSPSDLYRIGRRLALGEGPAGVPAAASAASAREALARLEKRLGESGARERLAEFGPRAVSYAGRFRLTDMDLPPYERTVLYRTPLIFSDRLYDLKITVARRLRDAELPAALLPLVLPGALDEMMASLKMAFAYDWASVVRASQAFSSADLDRLLDGALQAGRFVRDQSADALQGAQ